MVFGLKTFLPRVILGRRGSLIHLEMVRDSSAERGQ